MDFLSRYRNLTVLLVVVMGQLLLLAYQVKTNDQVPLLRVWAVSTVTPVEEGLEFARRHTIGLVGDYFNLIRVREQNDKLQRELGQLKLENSFLKNQLSTAERAKELAVFQDRLPSKTLAARVIGNGTGANSKVVFVDRGSSAGIENGLAVITPDGIVGKVVAAYPTASLVMLITDATFAAGVVSQKHHVHGTLKGQGNDPKCKVEYVQNEEQVENGEWFYTSGDDGIFPRGLPAGQVTSVTNGRSSKNIYVSPSGWQGGLDEVLIVTEGIHQPVPEEQAPGTPVKILAPPAAEANGGAPQSSTSALTTTADRLRQQYNQVQEQQRIQFGTGLKPPDFSKLGQTPGIEVKKPGDKEAAVKRESGPPTAPPKPDPSHSTAPPAAGPPKTVVPTVKPTPTPARTPIP